MPYIGNTPAEKYAAFNVQNFTTSATTSYTLDRAVANELDIRLVINNVIQQPGVGKAYTASGTTLTLSGATTGTDTMYAVYIGKAVQTVTPGANSVGPTALQDNSVTNAKLADATQGDIIYYGAAGAPAQLSAGTSGFFLKTQGAGANPIWAADTDTVTTLRPNVNPLIINGDCAISQRSTSVTGITGSGYNTIDRFKVGFAMGTWTQTQESLTSGNAYTDGFSNALKMDCTTADASVGSSDRLALSYNIEGQDLQLLKKGTANAEPVTISFWVKATKTGTNILELYDNDNNRQISIAYTVSSSDTWEYILLNLPADTTGVLGDDNGSSLAINWWMGAGSNFSSGTLSTSWSSVTDADRAVGQVNHADSTSNNFHITAAQLEVGTYTSATLPPFQHESYGNNLARCQRYYQMLASGAVQSSNGGYNERIGVGYFHSSTLFFFVRGIPVPLRVNGTIETVSGTDYFSVERGNGEDLCDDIEFRSSSPNIISLRVVGSTASGTEGQGGIILINNTSARVAVNSEL